MTQLCDESIRGSVLGPRSLQVAPDGNFGGFRNLDITIDYYFHGQLPGRGAAE